MTMQESVEYLRATAHMYAPKPNNLPKRSFASASMSRLTADWAAPQSSADAEIYSAIRTLRGRSRELIRNNEYAQGWMCLLENNVLGAKGVPLEMKAQDNNGQLDKLANDAIKLAWRDWCSRKYCTMSGDQCWREVEGIALRETASAGGVLIRHIEGAPNPYRYAIDVMEIDCLDTDLNTRSENGNEIRFGVELDSWRRPVAFHIWTVHPGDNLPLANRGKKRERLTISEISHLFWKERPSQTIGIPWLTAAMQALEHLGKYREAELVAARISACKGYAIEQEYPEGMGGELGEDSREEMQPGMSMFLDPGQKMVALDPTHPNTAFGDFVKSTLRGAASALRTNYNSLANDLESVNYSSMRAGKLEEVEEYMGVQEWLIEGLHAPVFPRWLNMSLAAGAIKMPNGSALPASKFDKFNKPEWKPRRWPWVDPQKDLNAAVMAINNRLKSRRQVIAEMGGDITTIDQEQTADGDLNFVAKPVAGAIIPDNTPA